MFEFGERVVVTQKFVRDFVRDGWGHKKHWRTKDIQRGGIYLGERTLANGIAHNSYEDGSYFEPKEYIRAALVCFSHRENPVYVPLDAIARDENQKASQ